MCEQQPEVQRKIRQLGSAAKKWIDTICGSEDKASSDSLDRRARSSGTNRFLFFSVIFLLCISHFTFSVFFALCFFAPFFYCDILALSQFSDSKQSQYLNLSSGAEGMMIAATVTAPAKKREEGSAPGKRMRQEKARRGGGAQEAGQGRPGKQARQKK